MNRTKNTCVYGRQIELTGNVLLLMGPIGTFFSRLGNYLERKQIQTYKVIFPFYEFGFKKNQIINFNHKIDLFEPFLIEVIKEKKIKHIFMYGDILTPHRIAIDTCKRLRTEGIDVSTEIFELGYLRPNYVTLEKNSVNFKSNIPKERSFYEHLIVSNVIPRPKYKMGIRLRKIWKGITFIQHSLTNYKIVPYQHKLQPKPIYLYYQALGLVRKYIYSLTEYKLKKNIGRDRKYFLVVLQVAIDSQIIEGSKFESVEDFIKYVIKSFKNSNVKDVNLVIKHHPRDRGYNNYSKLIKEEKKKYNLNKNIIYIHDEKIANLLRNPNCKGSVIVNSSVGIQALFHNIPVKALGRAIYDIDGLTDQKSLDEFWKDPFGPDRKLFISFYNYILQQTQINGNFDGFFPFDDVFKINRGI